MPGRHMHKRRRVSRCTISRRRFSHLAALAALSLAGRRAVAAPRAGGTAVVVGAGMAGLAAAIDLKAAGWTVVVIEGRDRVGGRIFTDRSLDGVPLDMGATWIHGIRGNPINALRTKYRLKVALTNYDAMLRYDADGLPLSAPREASMDRAFASLETAIAEAQEARAVDPSLGAFIDDFIEARSLSADARRSLGYSVNTEIEHEQAADVADLSLVNFDQDSQFGGPDVLFPNGYGQLPERLRAGLDIRTGHTVRSIAHDSSGVRVETQRGTFVGDRVVVTLPLGVLKHGDVGFTPILPEAKRAAIDRLGMGVLNKCYLKFPRVFWDPRPQLFGYVGAARGQWAEWLNMHRFTRQPVLLGFNAGSFGEQLESQSDEEVVASAMTVLRTIYGGSVPSPTGARVTRWKSDPFSRGAYSHIPPGASGGDYDALAASVAGRIFFAGEATSRQYPGTVHGAWLSGRRAAAEMTRLV